MRASSRGEPKGGNRRIPRVLVVRLRVGLSPPPHLEELCSLGDAREDHPCQRHSRQPEHAEIHWKRELRDEGIFVDEPWTR